MIHIHTHNEDDIILVEASRYKLDVIHGWLRLYNLADEEVYTQRLEDVRKVYIGE